MIIPSEIDLETVEAIIKDGNYTEFKWLQDKLENGIRVYNSKTGRFIKSDRFLKRLV